MKNITAKSIKKELQIGFNMCVMKTDNFNSRIKFSIKKASVNAVCVGITIQIPRAYFVSCNYKTIN